MEQTRRVHLIAIGRVQGVNYRYHACQTADMLQLTGFVRNLSDGSVEMVAEGPSEDLVQLITWARRGPRFAAVDDLQITYHPATGEYTDFRRYD